jgi:signal transduction histidine kinase/CheY-like chemotaxis protein
VNRIWRRFVDGTEIGVAIDAALQIIGESLNLERVRIRRFVEKGTSFATTHEWCGAGTAPGGRTTRTVDRKAFEGLYARLRRGDVIVIRAAQASAGETAAPVSPDADILPCSVAAPILEQGDITGWLALECADEKRAFDAADIALAQRLVNVIAVGRARAAVERALHQAKEEAVAANVAKSAFLANMSHELRTPLNGVIGMVDLLTTTALSDDQRRYARVARTAAGLLLSVINDVLDFSKIEAGKLELERAPFDLAEVLDDVVSVLSLGAKEKGLCLSRERDPKLPPLLVGDAARLRQVLVNLVNNAIKFTSSGTVSVRAETETESAAEATVRVEVRDTGIGINPSAQANLFRPFSQVDASTTRRYGGSGLGLAICREIVERMGGRLGLESSLGAGSTVWFVVTLAKAPPSVLEDQAKGRRPAHLSTIPPAPTSADRVGHVLLVEDSPINAEVAGEILRVAGHTFDLVTDGASAVEAVLHQKYDLVLMDCHLPGVDGYEATRRIRRLEAAGRLAGSRDSRLPIIALTASATKEELEQAMASGMDLHVSKPFEPRRLLVAIAARIEGAETRVCSEGPTPPAMLERALARLQSDRGLLRRIMRQFLECAPHARKRLAAAAEQRDAQAVGFEAHRLRGQAASFDADDLVSAIDAVAAAVGRDAWPEADAALREFEIELDRLTADLRSHAD